MPQEGQKISKKIHQIIWNPEDLKAKPEIRENIERLKALNPGWTYKLWTEADIRPFLLEHYGAEVCEAFERVELSYASPRSDLFRYLVLYIEGGVYLDIKSTITQPIEHHLQPLDRLLVAYWDQLPDGQGKERISPDEPCGNLMSWGLLSAPRHPIVRHIIVQMLTNIEVYNPWTIGVGVPGAFALAGPGLLTQVVTEERAKYPEWIRFIFLIQEWGGVFTIYKDVAVHQRGFSSNYRMLRTPLVWNIAWWAKLFFRPLFALRQWLFNCLHS